jgi:DUF1009 family protein
MNAARASAETVGLLAGSGRFPILFAEKARELGLHVACVGLIGEASAELQALSTHFTWAGLSKLGRYIRFFKQHGVQRFVMAGKIQKTKMFSPFLFLRFWPDWRTFKFWYFHQRRDNKDDTLLMGVIREFAKDGLTCSSALELCPELLVKDGILTKRAPTIQEEEDIAFGWQLAKEMGRLDVGQSVAVKDKAVLAVEAVEGTDRAILRAGELCRKGGFTVVKVAKPQQDMRFDVPTVGTNTIESIHKANGRVLAVEAGRTIILDERDTIALANRYGISIVAKAA